MIEVEVNHIKRFSAGQLVELLRRLLNAEALAKGIGPYGVHVPANITVADGGEDGRIQWSDGPDKTNWLPCRYIAFQCKIKDMKPAECKKAVHKEEKPSAPCDAIADVLNNKGAYIMFCKHDYVTQKLDKKISAIWEGLEACGVARNSNIKVDFYDANKISSWVNAHPSVACWVLGLAGVPVEGIRLWSCWAGDFDLPEYHFVPDDRFDQDKQAVSEVLSKPQGIVRIIGHSGLGKTRRAFEIFKPDGPQTPSLADSVLYTASVDRAKEIAEWMRLNKHKGILVVDDCSAKDHGDLVKIARHTDSCFSLLTLDYDVSQKEYRHTQLIELKISNDKIITDIIRQISPSLNQDDLDRIVKFSQGYPLMAVLLAEAKSEDQERFSCLSDEDLIKRMIYGRTESSKQTLLVAQACALFDYIGIGENKTDHTEFIIQNLCDGMSTDTYHQEVTNLEKRQVLQRRGDYMQLRPKPLAIYLASQRWDSLACGGMTRVKTLFLSGNMPDQLAALMCAQLENLDFVSEAKKIAAELCAADGPFGKAEVLFTELGSRIFRSLVKVNHDATVETLCRIFKDKTRQELLDFKSGRSNIVEALENLACRKETFSSAAEILIRLAAAENEPWSNNATGVFKNLYQVALSGTEASPKMKFDLIDWAIASGDAHQKSVAVQALKEATTTDHFSGRSNGRTQGSTYTLEEWKPKTYGELWNYYRAGLKRLVLLATAQGQCAVDAKQAIADKMYGLITNNLIADVHQAVEDILKVDNAPWPEALASVVRVLALGSGDMPAEYKAKVQELRCLLEPVLLEDKIYAYVSNFSYDFIEDTDFSKNRELISKRLENLADEVLKSGQFLQLLPKFVRGNHQLLSEFLKGVVPGLSNISVFVQSTLDELKNVPAEERNYNPLGFLLSRLRSENRDNFENVLDKLEKDPSIVHQIPSLLTFSDIDDREISRLCHLLEGGKINPIDIRHFENGKALAHLEPTQLEKLLRKLIDHNGAWVSLALLFMYLFDNPGMLEACDPICFDILCACDLSKDVSSYDRVNMERLAGKYIETGHKKAEFVSMLAQKLVNVSNQFDLRNNNMYKNFAKMCTDFDPSVSWPIFLNAAISDDINIRSNVALILGERFHRNKSEANILDAGEETLLGWCRQHPGKAPRFLVGVVPLLTSNGQWSPLVQSIIDEFGNDEKVMGALSASIGTFAYAGSLVPYFQQYLKPLEALTSHQHETVRDFARKQIRSLNAQIEEEKKREAEQELGIY